MINLSLLLIALFTGLSVICLTAALLPEENSERLKNRIKAFVIERDAKSKATLRLAAARSLKNLRAEPKPYMKQIVEQLKLADWLGTETAQEKLALAGYRGQAAEVAFLFFRFVLPVTLFTLVLFQLFVALDLEIPGYLRLCCAIAAAYIGIKTPEWFLASRIASRQHSIRLAFPDAMDLILICVETGMTIDQAFRRVAGEIGFQSTALAEELTLTMAELSYLPQRKVAYENFGRRTGLEMVKALASVLVQAERYGTPLGQALRVLSEEGRHLRLNDAEKKAAALGPKLTVPMVLFFLPVLFLVILMPAAIRTFNWS